MKRDRIIYIVSTGLMSLMMIMSVGMYFFNNAEISSIFTALGYPTYLVYPLAIAKILGIAAIWTRISTSLTYFAYAGFLYDFVLALVAHVHINDGEHVGAIAALVIWTVSFFYFRKLYA